MISVQRSGKGEEKMAEMEQYWAVLWNSGQITVGRYHEQSQIEDAICYPGTSAILGPFLAENREAAKKHAMEKLCPEDA